jgi:hypothetical protein
MRTREELEKRVTELERQLAGRRGVRKRASWEILLLPAYDIAMGPDPARGEVRGHARGFIAIGDIATGVIAIGGLARGVLAIGGAAIGLVSLGGLSIGALLAAGGLAIGAAAFGGGAIGGMAVGGGAIGVYACGGGAVGEHTVSAMNVDPEAARFFAEYGLGDMCGEGRPPPRRGRTR